MPHDRELADDEFAGYLPIGSAGSYQTQNLGLSPREPGGEIPWRHGPERARQGLEPLNQRCHSDGARGGQTLLHQFADCSDIQS